MKKRIGISFSKTNFKYYWDWFKKEDLNNEIELVELSYEKNNTEDIFKCDGFVLTGGVDIDPSFYNGSKDYNQRPGAFEPGRDLFEEKIYRFSQQNNLPVLGICRGMQLINVLHGGRLIQDLDDEGTEKHSKEEQTDKEHRIITGKDTLLFNITGAASGNVNSAHHQAIDPDKLGDNLEVNAYGDDKTIEGLEFKDKTDKAFMLCVQWHPERMSDQQNTFTKNIKKSFIEAVLEKK